MATEIARFYATRLFSVGLYQIQGIDQQPKDSSSTQKQHSMRNSWHIGRNIGQNGKTQKRAHLAIKAKGKYLKDIIFQKIAGANLLELNDF